jgi:NCS1 family nucleobase:cation symporter-1
MALSLINACTFNAYTGAFQVLAFGNMWRRFTSVSAMVRIVPFLGVMAVGMAVAFVGYRSFVTNLASFLDVLLVIFIPWSAVNLADYFLVRRGRYDVASFFSAGIVYLLLMRGVADTDRPGHQVTAASSRTWLP